MIVQRTPLDFQNNPFDGVIAQMAEGNPIARMITRHIVCTTRVDWEDPLRVLAAMGLRGDDLVVATFTHIASSLKREHKAILDKRDELKAKPVPKDVADRGKLLTEIRSHSLLFFTPAEVLKRLWAEMKEEAEEANAPRFAVYNSRIPTFNSICRKNRTVPRLNCVSEKPLHSFISIATYVTNKEIDGRNNLCRLLNDPSVIQKLREILPGLPTLSGYPICAGSEELKLANRTNGSRTGVHSGGR